MPAERNTLNRYVIKCHVTMCSSGQESGSINQHSSTDLKNCVALDMVLNEIKLPSLKAKPITP